MKKRHKLILGDNITELKKLPENSIDSVVTDPPYGLSFMNKKWDYDVPSVEFWREIYRVLKPGGHILSFGGTRTYHRMVVNIEDAGFEIRDQIMWLYGSGFPKSHNIGIAIDKKAGLIGHRAKAFVVAGQGAQKDKDTGGDLPNPNTKIESYKPQNEYEGWGTALKPANEPICLARKPLSEKSVGQNVLKWQTGGLNIDGCRVGVNVENEGRFPANIILDESAAELLDEQSGFSKTNHKGNRNDKGVVTGVIGFGRGTEVARQDSGGASRFFYVAKVSKTERNMGLDDFENKVIEGRDPGQDERSVAYKKRPTPTKNIHPTVKPINLMTYLCRLITPKNGIILDPFMGSGSTGVSALLGDFRFVGIELDSEYIKIAESRIENFEKYRPLIKN